MAEFHYAHVHASAGFSGQTFDICQGYNVSYATTAGDLVFAATGSTLTLSAGTWPSWIREVGKVFTTDSATNPGPFTVVSWDVTNKILVVLEAVVNETPAGITNVDGSADTKIIDVLLKAGNGVLTTDAPHALVSSGALSASRTLSLANMELEDVAQGGEPLPGRIFYLTVQNSDISPTRTITVSGSTSINGSPTLVIRSQADYLFHHLANGVWRANALIKPAQAHASIARVPFTAADWNAGTAKNAIKIIPSGSPAAGEVGPHALEIAGTYNVDIINTDLSPNEMIDVETQFDALGNITLVKAQKAKPFNGVAVIIGSIS